MMIDSRFPAPNSQAHVPKYLKKEKIGEGTYGKVYKAINTETSEVVALKKMEVHNPAEGISATILREISLVKELSHPNVIRYHSIFHCDSSQASNSLKDVLMENGKFVLVFEWLDQDLKKYMDDLSKKELQVDSQTLKGFMFQILSGLAHLHKRKIMHRDMKPQNILVDRKRNLKIADFGLARCFSIPIRPYTREVVTLYYRAPEILLDAIEYSTPIDIWSVGCIFVELMTKRVLFKGDSELDQLIKIMRTRGTPNSEKWPGVSSLRGYSSIQHYPNFPTIPWTTILGSYHLEPAGLDLLEKMLKYDPCERITAKQALAHVRISPL